MHQKPTGICFVTCTAVFTEYQNKIFARGSNRSKVV